MSQPLTRWYPAHTKPARSDVYQIRYPQNQYVCFAYYSDEGWGCGALTIEDAAKNKSARYVVQTKEWRGLAKPPK